MSIGQFFFTLFCIVFWCLGWFKITEPGMIFSFLRTPFDNLFDEIARLKAIIVNHRAMNNKPYVIKNEKRLKKVRFFAYLSKPFITCITCYASFWGVVVFATLNGLSLATLPYLALACVSASFIQTLIWDIYERV